MSARTKRPLSRRIQRRVFRVVNVPMRIVLGLPFATPMSGRLMLVYLTGRKTGKSYRQPVSYARDGDVLLTPGGGNWIARPEIVDDPGDIERLLAVMTAANPMAGRFVAIPKGPDSSLDPARLHAAVRYGFGIIRWHLDDAQAPEI